MLNDIRSELLKIVSQKKNYIAVVGHLVLMSLCVVGVTRSADFYHFNEMDKLGIKLEDFQGLIDGQFFARMMIIPTFVILMPILICTVGGDLIAGEIQDGSLRLYASRTRKRTGIIFSKIVAMFLFSFAYCIYFGLSSLLAGYLFFGWGNSQIIPLFQMGVGTDLEIMSSAQALLKYVMVVIYYSFSVMTLGCLTLFFSTLFNRMTSATVAGITLYFVSYILEGLPFLTSLKFYYPSHVMNGCVLFWLDPVPIWRVAHNFTYLIFYLVIFCAATLISFNNKDIS